MKSPAPASTFIVRNTQILATDSREQYRQKLARVALDEMYQFVAVLDVQGTLLEVNRAALEGAGLAPADVEGKPFWECYWWTVSREAQETLREAVRRAAAGEFVRYDVEVFGRAGGKETIVIDFSMIPVRDQDGRVVFIVPEGRDITEKKAQEREIAAKNRELQALLERIRELDAVKTKFFANISHEFRTPLTLMLGPTEDALESADRALRGPDLETVHRNALRLLKLVNTLLDFARIETGRIQASYAPTNLSALTADLASSFRSAVERGGLVFDVDCPLLTEPVYVDREMWEKIVLNLLSNALKFTFEGTISIGLRSDDGSAVLTVRDTGTGIPAAEVPHLFERFHRVQGARARTHEGSGIGLALVDDLVRLHGGRVRVDSLEGSGTTFEVRVPLGRAHLPDERVVDESPLPGSTPRAAPYVEEALRWLPSSPPGGPQSSPPRDALDERGPPAVGEVSPERILVADDNADMRDYLVRLLGTRWRVEAVSNGLSALEAIRRDPPDLVLSDVMMPQLDGFGLVRELRVDPTTRTVPVILLSARAGEEATTEGLDAGAHDYLVKPFSARELMARVRAQLQVAAVRREANAFQERFVAILGHDLRNPLAAIDMARGLLFQHLTDKADSSTMRLLARIASSSRRMARMIEQVLDLTRSRLPGGLELNPVPMDLGATLAAIVDELRTAHPSRTIDLRCAPRPGTWDPDRLEQVFSNLIGNAIQHGLAGTPVTVEMTAEAGDVSVSVHNEGPAIPEGQRPTLFSAFRRGVRDSRTDKTAGLGLGLHISHEIVGAHGGSLAVESDAAHGTTFRVILPASMPARRRIDEGRGR